MDEMLIKSDFTKAIIVKLVKKIIKSKLGIDPKIDLEDIHVTIGDKTLDVDIGLHVEVDKGELFQIVKNVM